MDGFSALRACVAQLSEVVDAVERISDTCVMTPEEGKYPLDGRQGDTCLR
jgi:hypothetical protein